MGLVHKVLHVVTAGVQPFYFILRAGAVCAPQRTLACCLRPNDVLVLPFDLMDSAEKLEAAAKAADEAFGGAGVDFLIHNAGRRREPIRTAIYAAHRAERAHVVSPLGAPHSVSDGLF